jgi:hypothetical protein
VVREEGVKRIGGNETVLCPQACLRSDFHCRAVAEHLGHAGHDLGGIVSDADHRIRPQLLGMLDHPVVGIRPCLFTQLSIERDISPENRLQAGEETADDGPGAADKPPDQADRLHDPVSIQRQGSRYHRVGDVTYPAFLTRRIGRAGVLGRSRHRGCVALPLRKNDPAIGALWRRQLNLAVTGGARGHGDDCSMLRNDRKARPSVARCQGWSRGCGFPRYLRAQQSLSPLLPPLPGWLRPARVGVQTLCITPGSPWENGYIESFNARLRDELLDRELFDTLWEVPVLVGALAANP